MLAETTAFTLDGISARPVRVEVDVQRGLPVFQIVGLPDAAVREAARPVVRDESGLTEPPGSTGRRGHLRALPTPR